MEQARLFIAIALSFLVFFVWNFFFTEKPEPPEQEPGMEQAQPSAPPAQEQTQPYTAPPQPAPVAPTPADPTIAAQPVAMKPR